jgi:hypothetical protein
MFKDFVIFVAFGILSPLLPILFIVIVSMLTFSKLSTLLVRLSILMTVFSASGTYRTLFFSLPFFLVVLGFELSTSHLLGRCFITEAKFLALFALHIFWIWSPALPLAGLDWDSPIYASHIARIRGMSHCTWLVCFFLILYLMVVPLVIQYSEQEISAGISFNCS